MYRRVGGFGVDMEPYLSQLGQLLLQVGIDLARGEGVFEVRAELVGIGQLGFQVLEVVAGDFGRRGEGWTAGGFGLNFKLGASDGGFGVDHGVGGFSVQVDGFGGQRDGGLGITSAGGAAGGGFDKVFFMRLGVVVGADEVAEVVGGVVEDAQEFELLVEGVLAFGKVLGESLDGEAEEVDLGSEGEDGEGREVIEVLGAEGAGVEAVLASVGVAGLGAAFAGWVVGSARQGGSS